MRQEIKQNYSEKIRLVSLELLNVLDQDIKSMLGDHSATGRLRSGETIRKTMNYVAKGNSNLYQKILWVLEALSLLGAMFIAGMWYQDPNGNFEPILFGLGLVIPLIAIGIKFGRKK